ncbi:hypothetical protein OVA24_16140 [Luteolibacter sp. SL250]|uniref:hypothetical protein n=1 Tax=Luteolibacter sp. SL250 TaxID=2995170 RepID=UPI002271026A|nr:hypothetical protein [Luteolibacter sp. SL250]WAC18760.1 hypothetical protein OVA24_16140 [Luteolibacter sp. SL250]
MDQNPDDFRSLPERPFHEKRKSDLSFLIKELKRLYPGKSSLEIHLALEQALEEQAPSISRTTLRRRVRRILDGGATEDGKQG